MYRYTDVCIYIYIYIYTSLCMTNLVGRPGEHGLHPGGSRHAGDAQGRAAGDG